MLPTQLHDFDDNIGRPGPTIYHFFLPQGVWKKWHLKIVFLFDVQNVKQNL